MSPLACFYPLTITQVFPAPFLENLNGCWRCHKSLSPLKTHADADQNSSRKAKAAWVTLTLADDGGGSETYQGARSRERLQQPLQTHPQPTGEENMWKRSGLTPFSPRDVMVPAVACPAVWSLGSSEEWGGACSFHREEWEARRCTQFSMRSARRCGLTWAGEQGKEASQCCALFKLQLNNRSSHCLSSRTSQWACSSKTPFRENLSLWEKLKRRKTD